MKTILASNMFTHEPRVPQWLLNGVDIFSCALLIIFMFRILVLLHESLPLIVRLLVVAGAFFACTRIVSIWDGHVIPTLSAAGLHTSLSLLGVVMLWRWRRLKANPVMIAANRKSSYVPTPQPANATGRLTA